MPDYDNANAQPDDDSPMAVHNWPNLNPVALQGVCGEIVTSLMPYTEADPAAVTVTVLAAAGNMVGRQRYALAGNDRHPARIWPLVTGPTADGAKGTSWSTVRPIVEEADPTYLAGHLVGGIVSGEGITEQVRDGNGVIDPDARDFDEGVPDKRLLILETEFAAALAKGARHGSSLTPTLRQAWDGGTLRSLGRKSNNLCATDPHITVIGHITPGELRSKLSAGEVDGGTVNRFLMILSRRSQELPDGGNLPTTVRDNCAHKLKNALAAAGRAPLGPLQRTSEAAQLWREQYPKLVAARPDGWFASATARAQAQALRLSVAYAVLDGSEVITSDHLAAALALWDYAEASAKVLFAEIGYEKRRADAEVVRRNLRERDHATRTDLGKVFNKHKTAREMDAILAPMITSGEVAQETVETGGRPKTLYSLRNKRNKRDKPTTSADGATFFRFPRNCAEKGSVDNDEVNGLNPHISHNPQGAA